MAILVGCHEDSKVPEKQSIVVAPVEMLRENGNGWFQDLTINAHATSGLAVYRSVLTNNAFFTGESLEITAEGDIVISFNQPGDHQYAPADPVTIQIHAETNVSRLWRTVLRPYLADPLWLPRDVYDAGHAMMMPVLAAHDRQRSDWQHDLREHYRRFMSDRAALDSGLLNRLQYLNTFAVFLSLSTGTNSDNEIRDQVEYLTAEWHRAWFLPAWQWGRTPFPGGMPERIAWKLTTPNPSLTYYRAIIDEEEFGLAIASSLIVARRKLGMADDPDMIAALAWAGTIYRDEMVAHPDGGIIFQPGVYRDHRDYQYAGHQVLAPSLPPSPVDGIGPDTSHSHRTLVFLRQHTMAAQLLGQDATVFIRTARGFAQRFRCLLNERTLNGRRFWSTVNYTSGHDGLYRYRYVTTSESGYGPGELSGTMTLGWWGGNADGGLADFYGDMLTTFPLSEAAIRLYVGPNTTRVRHPMMTWPTFFNNGFAELLVRLASGQRAGRRLVSTNG